jgi:predicted Na+-dependent transporter
MKSETKWAICIITYLIGLTATVGLFNIFIPRPALDWVAVVVAFVWFGICAWLYKVL